MGTQIELRVPDIGDFKDVAVIELLVKPGDTVKCQQSLITVESDKATIDIPSPADGVIAALRVELGDKVSQDSPIATLTLNDATVAAINSAIDSLAPLVLSLPAATTPPPDAPISSPLPQAESASERLPHASPSIRRLARELGVPLDEIKGTGIKGRIQESDVQGFVKAVLAGSRQTRAQEAAQSSAARGSFPDLLPWPQVDFAKFGPIERRDLSRIKKLSGANLHRNWMLIPHVTNHDQADITELDAFRQLVNQENEKGGVKITLLAFLIKAAAATLKNFPEFNASLDGEQLILKNYFHIGFAADTPNGLVVPVIRDVDRKGIIQISQEMAELAKKAREGRLGPAEMSGGCFTLSSLGGIGGKYFTPIINAPEVAIMGVCKSSIEPVWDGKAFMPRLILPLSLAWDHRVIDGAAAARFNKHFAALLADFRRISL